MNSKPRKRYTAEFKTLALGLVETGRPVAEIASELCISTNLPYPWKQASRPQSPPTQDPCAANQ